MTTSTSFAQMANNQSISLSSALRANTPPIKGQTPSRKFLTLSIFFLLSFFCTTNAWAEDVVYKTAKFGSSYNSGKVSSYTSSWYSTYNGFRVDIVNANNNNNGWSFIKMGRESAASTGTITTNAKIDAAITKVTLTIDAITANNITSITLKTATSSNGTYTSVGTFTKAKGAQTVTLASPTANLFYKIEVVCTKGSSNGLIQISQVDYYKSNAAAATKYTVTLKDDDSTLPQSTAGESVTLPSREGCDGYEFVGWTNTWKATQTTWTTTAPTYISAGSYTPTANVNLYPVYTKTETTPGTTTTTTDYVLTDLANIKSTDVVVITSKNSSGLYYVMSNSNGTGSAPAATKITVSSSKLSSTPDNNLKWNISNNNGTLTIYPNGTTSTWLYCTSTNNGVRVGTNTNKTFTIDSSTGYLKHIGTSRYLGVYNNQDWRCYTSTTTNIGSQTLAFFVETTTTTTTSTTTTSYISVPDCATETIVTFKLNGGSGTFDDVTLNSNTYAIPETEPTRNGYNFTGWKIQGGDETIYKYGTSNSSISNITESITLVAQWKANTYTITLNANGGSGNTTRVAATYDSSTLNPSSITNPTKTGHTFGGWYSGEGGTGSLVINTSGKLQANVSGYTGANGVWKATTNKTLYAKWTPAVYTINYKDQGGANFSGQHEAGYPTTHTYNAATTLKSASKNHYTFGGWYKENDCSGTPVATLGATEYTDNITLYAQWTAKTYTITLDANGGTFVDNRDGQTKGSATFDYIYGTYATYSDAPNLTEYYTDLKRDGYQFDKWVSGGSPWNKLFTSTGNRTIQAQWSKLYSITLSENGTTKELTPQTSTSYTLPTELTAGGSCQDGTKELVGWSTVAIPNPSDKPTSNFYELGETVTLTADQTTFYAVFATPTTIPGGTEEKEQTTTLNFSAQGYENQQEVTSLTIDDVTVTFNKGTNSNVPKYYNTGTAVRVYGGGYFTVSGVNLAKIVITTSSGEDSNEISADCGAYETNTKTWTGSNQSVKFTIGGTTGHRRINSIAVTYTTTVQADDIISYSNYSTTCVKLPDPVWEGATIDKTSFTVNCGERSPMTGANAAAIISFPTEDIYNFTKDITIEATTGFLVSTSQNVDANYKSSVSLSPLVGTANANTFNDKHVYVRAEAPAMSEEDLSGTITIKNSKGETLQTFSVTADVTCTQYTLTLNDRGTKTTQLYYAGASVPKPEDPTGVCTDPIHYEFDGWATSTVAGGSTTYTKVSFPYTMPAKATTLYAVYRYTEGNTDSDKFMSVDKEIGELVSGVDYVLTGYNTDDKEYALSCTQYESGKYKTKQIDVSESTTMYDEENPYYELTTTDNEIIWTITGDDENGYSFQNKSTGKYLNIEDGSLALNNSDPTKYTIEHYVGYDSESGKYVQYLNVIIQPLEDYSYYLSSYYKNSTAGVLFNLHSSSTLQLYLYKRAAATLYTTSPACDPMITIGSAEPVMVTSANGIRVDAVQNITIAATNLDQNADKAQVSIKIVSDNSAFKFKEVGADGNGETTPLWTGIANATFDKTLCVTYTPTVVGQEETATLTVTAYRHNGSKEYASATMQVRGRSLPEQFVLVASTTDGWVALPNTLGTGSTASIPYPIAVEVDDDANPTSIPQAPSTTIYKAAARSSVNDVPTGLRFTTEAGGYLQASTSETNIWLSSNNSENMQSWTLNSTDFVDYSIRVNNSAEGAYLNYNTTQKKIGNYKSDNKLRILPVGAVCEQHAAPEDIEASSVRATSATIQWSAVSTATAGYEYRIGATGEWTKIGNVTELEITGLDPLTNYVVYVRASVEGAIINCSNEAEAEFTTLNCDDVPTNITHTSSSQSITVSWEAKAATSIVKLYSDKEGTTEVKSIESSSPCTLSDLEKYTTYYVQILAGGTCPSQIIEVSTLIPNINIAEWMEDGILVDVDTDEDVSVIIENEESYGSATGQSAEDLFFSKYFEATGNVKLLALYNGTNADIDLTQYSIKFSNKGKDYTGSNYTEVDYEATVDLSEDLPENRRTLIAGQELILISYANDGSSNSKPITNPDGTTSNVNQSDYGVLACAAENKQESGWDRYIRVTSPALNFSGNDAIALYKNTELIDIIGGGNASKANMTTVVSPAQTFMDAAGWYNAAGYEIVDLKPSQNKDYALSTNRCLLVRLNSVISGAKAVEKNTTDFVTLGGEFGEWMGKQIPDDDAACDGFNYVGGYNYSEYYTKYNTVGSEQVFPGENRTDGTVKITIEGLPNYSCHNIKLNLKIGEDLKLTEITKVPILISDEQTTKITSSTFTTLKSTLGVIDPETKEKTDLTDEQLIEKCETCDIVVLANGKLTHETDGIDQFRDLTIYPEGTFHNNDNISVDRLLVHAKRDEVGCAIIENEGVTLTTNAIAHTKRIDAQYWYPFSLPYNCNIADITQANGESLGTYGVHWGIQYYDGKKRQESGTSAGIGQSSNFWTPIYNSNEQLKAYQGYMIALFDASVSSPTEMRTIYFPPVSAQMYTESGIDSKETTITSWNVNLEAEKRHHGWNFTGSPYISVFNPQATGLSEDRGLFSEVLIVSGHYDQGSNEYLYDDEFVYVSIPSPNGAKYYDQYITSATSLKPFTAYFVQAIDPTSGNDETQTLAYAKAGRELPSSAPRRSTSTRQRVLVELGVTAPDGQTDNTGIWVDEKYTSAYEIAADLTKMYVAGDRPQLYTMAADNEKMAYNALPDEMAGNVQLGLYAPTAGSYTLFINERVSRLKGVERVDLLYNNVVVADLLSSAYVIDVPKKGAVNGYTISVCRKANVTTAIDNISGQPINIITGDGYLTLEGIVSDAQVSVYDMLGRLVAAQNANDETKIRIPFIVQGVYNVVVKNEQGMTTIKVVLR